MELLTIINLVTLAYALYVIHQNRTNVREASRIAKGVSEQADQLIYINQEIAHELKKARDAYESINEPCNQVTAMPNTFGDRRPAGL